MTDKDYTQSNLSIVNIKTFDIVIKPPSVANHIKLVPLRITKRRNAIKKVYGIKKPTQLSGFFDYTNSSTLL
jgi:hypothetical protein